MMRKEPTRDNLGRPQGDGLPLVETGKGAPDESIQGGRSESQPLESEVLKDTVGQREPSAATAVEPSVSPLPDERLQAILNLCEGFQDHLDETNQVIGEVKHGQELQSAKLRELSDKLDDAATSLSEPRIRDLLTSLLLLHDLIDQMASAAVEAEPESDHCRNYGVLLSQILQMLALHGVEAVPTAIPFDRGLHRAAQSQRTDEPSEDGRIVRVFRKGFKSKRRVLRYADVEVLSYPTPDRARIEGAVPASVVGREAAEMPQEEKA